MLLTVNKLRKKWLYTGSIFCLVIFFNAAVLFAATATLSWNPPATNSDGSNLTDLEGYVIYFGFSPYDYTQYIDVGNVTTYVLNDLVYDITYYFSVTAYDTSGNESDYSVQTSTLISSTQNNPEISAAEGIPEIVVSDSAKPPKDLQLPFGEVTEFNLIDQTVTIKNNGNADLEMGNISQTDSSSSPFSIYNDGCSLQSIAPSGSCSFTVTFSPDTTGYFTNIITIPSNDTDESMVAVTLTGTGLSSASNNPPSEPILVSPKNNGRGSGKKTTFTWKKSSDPDGDTITYDLIACQDPEMTTGCETQTNIASVTSQDIYYAGIGSFSTGLIFSGIVFILPFNRRKRKSMSLVNVIIIMAGILILVSCGGGGSSGHEAGVISSDVSISADEVSQTLTALNSGTTYYWQVVARDGKGGDTYSFAWSFETEQE